MIIICGHRVVWLACGACARCLFCCACQPTSFVIRVAIPLRHIHGVDSWRPGPMVRGKAPAALATARVDPVEADARFV